MARPIKNNRNVIQSYIFTVSRHNFSAGEKRIMYRLVEMAQNELQGIMIRDHMHKIEPFELGRTITMPVADILTSGEDQNYSYAKKAFRSLAGKFIEYEDNEIWLYTGIINMPKFNKAAGTVTFAVQDDVWRAMLDFTKGYRKYELLTAFKFKSVYAMRMYELISGGNKSRKPMEFDFEEIKKMFGVADKYKLVGHFKSKVLDVAKAELDQSSPWSFNYVEVKEGRKIIGFKFFPTYNPDNKDPQLYKIELQSKVSAVAQISSEVYDLLRYSLGFDLAAINKNKTTIIEGEKHIPDFFGFLHELIGPSRTAENRIGYVINAIKKKTAEGTYQPQPSAQEPAAAPQEPTQTSVHNRMQNLADKFNVNNKK